MDCNTNSYKITPFYSTCHKHWGYWISLTYFKAIHQEWFLQAEDKTVYRDSIIIIPFKGEQWKWGICLVKFALIAGTKELNLILRATAEIPAENADKTKDRRYNMSSNIPKIGYKTRWSYHKTVLYTLRHLKNKNKWITE